MNLIEAQNLAVRLMSKHNLTHWSFGFNQRKRAVGICRHGCYKIELSIPFTKALEVDQVTDTILHEIAHALVGVRHGHDHVWQRKALEIGCNGERTANLNVSNEINYKYKATCPCCGKVIGISRRPKRDGWCRCTNRNFKEEWKLQFVQQY